LLSKIIDIDSSEGSAPEDEVITPSKRSSYSKSSKSSQPKSKRQKSISLSASEDEPSLPSQKILKARKPLFKNKNITNKKKLVIISDSSDDDIIQSSAKRRPNIKIPQDNDRKDSEDSEDEEPITSPLKRRRPAIEEEFDANAISSPTKRTRRKGESDLILLT